MIKASFGFWSEVGKESDIFLDRLETAMNAAEACTTIQEARDVILTAFPEFSATPCNGGGIIRFQRALGPVLLVLSV